MTNAFNHSLSITCLIDQKPTETQIIDFGEAVVSFLKYCFFRAGLEPLHSKSALYLFTKVTELLFNH